MEQLTFDLWLRGAQKKNPRLAGWHFYFLSAVQSEAEIRALRKWCKANIKMGFKLKPERVITPILALKKCIGVVVWIEDTDDALLFKLRWSGHE